MTEVSIVIPTMNRARDLKEVLHSILKQTKLPKEVIVVDDSDNYKTRDLIEQMRNNFLSKEIALKYERGKEERKSISLARNIGAAQSTGEIVTFLDDDVMLDNEYLEKILEVFKEYPNTLGVQGYITNARCISGTRRLLSNSLYKIFYLFYREKERCRVLPSGHLTYPYSVNGVIKCQWVCGPNSSYKKELFESFKFDENLREYSIGEDADISYRILRRHPDSLYMTSRAKLVHKASPASRRDSKHLIYTRTAYHTYLFYKNIEQTKLNKIIFIWSLFGQFVTTFFFLYKKEPRSKILMSLIGSYVYTLTHLNKIKNGDFTTTRKFYSTPFPFQNSETD